MDYLGLPDWGQYLIEGLLTFVMIAVSAVTLTRAGRSPYYALLIAIPFVQIIAIWSFAFTHWPKVKKIK